MRSHGMGLLVEMIDVAPDEEEEARAWLDKDHLGRRLSATGICGAAAYEAIKGSPKLLNLYEAESVHDFYSFEFQEIQSTPSKRDREMSRHITNTVRLVCGQVYPGMPPSGPACPTVEIAGLAPVIQIGRIFVPPEEMSDFNGWYAQDRAPLAEKVPGVRRIRRYVPVEGDSVMVVLYEVEDESVFDQREWKEMGATPWTNKVRGYYQQAEGSPGRYRRRGYAH